MTQQTAIDLARQALMLAMLISMPLLVVGLVVGVIVAVIQAVTQIQEMTLTFIPKIIAMALAAALLMPYMLTRLSEFAADMFGPMPIP